MPQPESETIFDDLDNQDTGTGEDEVVKEKPEGQEEEQELDQELPEAKEIDLGGLPFKTVEALVKGYKDLQGHATKRNQEFATLQQTLRDLAPLLTKKQEQEIKEDPEAFVKAFVENPRGVLDGLVQNALQTALKKNVEPIQTQVGGLGARIELKEFMNDHPEFTDNDVDLLIGMMDKYPEIRSRPDRLEAWYKLLQMEHPEYGERLKKTKSNLERSAADAKRAASLGGRQTSNPKQPDADEFDELIDLYHERQKFWRDD